MHFHCRLQPAVLLIIPLKWSICRGSRLNFVSFLSRLEVEICQEIFFFVAALSLSLLLGRGTAFRSRLRHQRPSGFPTASKDSSIYSFLPVVATLFYVLHCHLVLFCGFTRFLLCVLVYSGFMYRFMYSSDFTPR